MLITITHLNESQLKIFLKHRPFYDHKQRENLKDYLIRKYSVKPAGVVYVYIDLHRKERPGGLDPSVGGRYLWPDLREEAIAVVLKSVFTCDLWHDPDIYITASSTCKCRLTPKSQPKPSGPFIYRLGETELDLENECDMSRRRQGGDLGLEVRGFGGSGPHIGHPGEATQTLVPVIARAYEGD